MSTADEILARMAGAQPMVDLMHAGLRRHVAENFGAFGLRFFSSPLATRLVVTYSVERWSIRKRRKNWRVVRHEKRVPCAFQTPQGIYLHPTLYDEFVKQSSPPTERQT